MSEIKDVEKELSRTSESLFENFDELKKTVKDVKKVLSPGEHIRANPGLALAGAVVSGLIVGSFAAKALRRHPLDVSPLAETVWRAAQPLATAVAITAASQLARSAFPNSGPQIELVQSLILQRFAKESKT